MICSTECHLSHNCIFFCPNNTFFINHVIKFKHQPDRLMTHVKIILALYLGHPTFQTKLHIIRPACMPTKLPYFPAYKTNRDFFVRNLRKK